LAYRPTDKVDKANNSDLWDEENEEEEDNSPVPEEMTYVDDKITWLHKKYRDFFDTCNTDRLAPNRAIDHAIKLKPGTELPYMRMYNMSPAKLKVLDEYINDALAKGWIRESKSSAGAPILFIPRKSGEFRLAIHSTAWTKWTVDVEWMARASISIHSIRHPVT
jgi:hypothetical protein